MKSRGGGRKERLKKYSEVEEEALRKNDRGKEGRGTYCPETTAE